MNTLRIVVLVAVGLSAAVVAADHHRDAYMDDARVGCEQNKDAIACAKFKALSYLDAVAGGQVSSARAFNTMFSPLAAAGVRLVKMPSGDQDTPYELFDDVEQRSDDSEITKMWKFGLRQVERFARQYSVAVAVPETNSGVVPRIISEDDVNAIENGEARGKKKKLQLLLPLLILLKFFKLKVLLIPILLGVLAIKKIILLAAVFLPSILGLLKYCKQQPFYHEYSSPAGYDYGVTSYAAGGATGSTYGKDLYTRRNYEAQNLAYRAQTPTQQ